MAIETAFRRDIDAETQSRFDEAGLARLAGRQHGVISRAQLLALGLGRGGIRHRVASGRLHPIHRGVFAVGHRVLSREGHWLAAVLAAGPGAVISHRSAAALWGIHDSRRAKVDVTAPRQCRRPGIDAHHTTLAHDEITQERGIPVTTPARTLLDLAEQLTPQRLERAVHEAEYRRLTSPLSVDALLTRHPKRRGTAALRTILNRNDLGRTRTKTELEIAFLAFLDAHHIERPKVNEPIGPYTVDALWPEQRLIAELDSRQAHHTTRAFEDDRARDRALLTTGYRVLRITWRHLHEDDATIAAQLRALLARATTPTAP
jgi:very-short-patch-repair endonuclease